MCGFLGRLTPVHWCVRSVCSAVCVVPWATRLLFTGVHALCVVLCVWCPGPLGSCSPVCPLRVLCCLCGVLSHLAPVHQCVRLACCVACAVSWVTWLLFTNVPFRCVVLCLRCPGPLGSCSPVCTRCVLCCVCSVMGHVAPVHRCVCSVYCAVCVVSWATWFLFTDVYARRVVLCVRCPGTHGSCSPVCTLGVLWCVCAVLGRLAPVHQSARSVCSAVCVVSWATWLLFIGVPALCVVLYLQCPGQLGSCSSVCPLGVFCCMCGVMGHLAPVHRCARYVFFAVCVVS